MIRRGEARAATRCCNIPEAQLHFMDMPFYETGRVRKKPLRRGRHPHHGRSAPQGEAASDLRGRRPLRSARHAPHLPAAPSLQACKRRAQKDDWYRRLRSLALPRRVAGMGAAPNRNGSAAQPAGTRSEADRDLQARIAKGPGPVPRHRPARVLATGRGAQPRHRANSTTSSASPSTKRSKASCSGAAIPSSCGSVVGTLRAPSTFADYERVLM